MLSTYRRLSSNTKLIDHFRYSAHVQSNLAWLAAAADGKEKVSTQMWHHCECLHQLALM